MADSNNQDPITATIPDEPQLDTPVSDAAIDDIVAEEADKVLAAEDAVTAAQADSQPTNADSDRKGHPIFWLFIGLIAFLAIFVVYVLTSPGISLPFAP